MNAKSNLLKYMDKKSISKPEFYRITGLSNGFLDKNDNISSKNIKIIISSFPDLSLHWLITGDGEMINFPTSSNYIKECSFCEEKNQQIEDLRYTIKLQKESIENLQNQINQLQRAQEELRIEKLEIQRKPNF